MAHKFIVNVVTGQGGEGHYATYRALKAVAEQQGLPWEFQVTDMDEIITGLSQAGDIKNAYEMFGFSGHDLYNLMVKGGWTWLWPLKMRMNKLLVKLNHSVGVGIFKEHWRRQQPDLVVSMMPLYNKGLWESLQQAKPGTPFVTVLTDFADCPPAFWFDPQSGNKLVCGTTRAVEQARSLGISNDRIVQHSGLVVHPNFQAGQGLPATEKRLKRKLLGLHPDCPTALIMFGGNGADVMHKIAQRLERLENNVQLIFMCGRNQAVMDALKAYDGPQKRLLVGFTDEMMNYMQISDFFIGKPGNVSVSEALAMKLPVITACGATTMSQERYCAEWVAQQHVGIVIPSFKQIDRAVTEMLLPDVFARYRTNLEKFENRAVFELADLLKNILAQQSMPENTEDERRLEESRLEESRLNLSAAN